MGKTAFLDPLPLPNEKKDRFTLLLQPSTSTPLSPALFSRTAACTAIYSCRSPDESIENDLLIGCTMNSSSFSLMLIHSSPILVTFLNFLSDFATSPDTNSGGRQRSRFPPSSITTKFSSPAEMGMLVLRAKSRAEGAWLVGISQFWLEIEVLQSGQLELFWSQMSMQSIWKRWLQIGIFLNCSSVWNSVRQTAHSPPVVVVSLMGFL